MPAAIPVIAAFAAAAPAVGAIAAGTAGLAAYATVAGAVLTGVGALTGKKDLMKVGSVLSIGGGLANAFGSMGDMGIGSTGQGGMGAQAIEAAASNGLADVAAPLAEAAGSAGSAVSQIPEIGMGGVTSAGAAQDAATGVANAQATTAPTTLADMAARNAGQAPAAGGMTGEFATQTTTTPPPVDASRIGEYAKGISLGDIAKWAGRAGSGVADFMQKNPALMKVGGEMLSSMYGPQAEKLDWEKSLYERSRRNLNSPIAMSYTPTGGK